MSLKKSSSNFLQNLRDQVKNLDKSLTQQAILAGKEISNQDFTSGLPFDIPMKGEIKELVDEKINSVIDPSTGTNLGISSQGAVDSVLYVYNGDNDDFGDKSLLGKNRWIIVWGGLAIFGNVSSRQYMLDKFKGSNSFITKNWVFADYNISGGRETVLKSLRKKFPNAWCISSMGYSAGGKWAMKQLGRGAGRIKIKDKYEGLKNRDNWENETIANNLLERLKTSTYIFENRDNPTKSGGCDLLVGFIDPSTPTYKISESQNISGDNSPNNLFNYLPIRGYNNTTFKWINPDTNQPQSIPQDFKKHNFIFSANPNNWADTGNSTNQTRNIYTGNPTGAYPKAQKLILEYTEGDPIFVDRPNAFISNGGVEVSKSITTFMNLKNSNLPKVSEGTDIAHEFYPKYFINKFGKYF